MQAKSARAPQQKKALVIATHGDYEVIAQGGTIIRARREVPGLLFKAVLLTTSFERQMARKRAHEFELSCKRLKVEPIVLDLKSWGPADRNGVRFLQPSRDDFTRFWTLLVAENPGCVFVPHALDAHPDHVEASRMASAILKESQFDTRVFFTQTWGSIRKPNTLVGFDTDVLHEKLWVLEAHHSQLGRNRFAEFVEAEAVRNAVLGPELVRGFGVKGIAASCAEVFERVDFKAGKQTRLHPAFFAQNKPLTESIFIA